MGRKKRIRLTSVATGENRDFNSYTEAGIWLGRSHAYIKHCQDCGTVPVKLGTTEQYIVTDLGIGEWAGCSKEKAQKREQLCNTCARASGFCTWSENLTPVKGWDAQVGTDQSGNFYTWSISGCPLYISEGKTRAESRSQ